MGTRSAPSSRNFLLPGKRPVNRCFRPMLRNARPFHALFRRLLPSVFAVFALAAAAFFAAPEAFAQLPAAQQQVQQTAQAAGVGGTTDLIAIIGRLINIFLGLLGVILLVLLLYAGFLWMTAGGNAEQIEKAKGYIRNAIIGLVIIASAFAITRFVLGLFEGAMTGGGGVTGGGGPPGGFVSSAGSLGGGIIESHFPPRDATDIPRNTAIIVTFKKPIKINSLIKDYNDNGTPDDLTDDTVTEGVNDTAVKIHRTDAGQTGSLTSAKVRVKFTDDRRTFVFRPVELLGSSTVNVGYTVELLGGQEGVLLEDGSLAFGGAFASGYLWNFEVGTFVDQTPPRVTSVVPAAGNQYDRNVVVQINFNEAIDPTSASGFVTNGQGFQNIQTHAGGVATPNLDGEYKISNQYHTVEFIPSQLCGTNSCGESVYCLPGGASIDAIARAATLDGAGPAAQFTSQGFDGVVDVASNSLDGNADGTAAGQGADDYSWGFGTTNNINLTPPAIEATMPPSDPSDPGQSNIDPFAPVTVRFDTILLSSSFNTEHATIQTKEPPDWADTFWWSTGQQFLTDKNEPVTDPAMTPVKSLGLISHRMYATSTEYDPFLFSGIRNLYQNCFNPVSSPGCPIGPGGANCCQDQRTGQACSF